MIDDDCDPDEFCDDGLCQPAAGGECEDDAYEDNDDDRSGTQIEAQQTLADAVACAGDDDYFWFGSCGPIRVTATFSHADGDIDMELIDGADLDLVLQTAASSDDNEVIEYEADAGGIFHARVFLFAEGDEPAGAAYDIEVETVPCD